MDKKKKYSINKNILDNKEEKIINNSNLFVNNGLEFENSFLDTRYVVSHNVVESVESVKERHFIFKSLVKIGIKARFYRGRIRRYNKVLKTFGKRIDEKFNVRKIVLNIEVENENERYLKFLNKQPSLVSTIVKKEDPGMKA